MGSARHRSWSHTRRATLDRCPRALYLAYFPWGDEDQALARFLRRAATPESLAGTVVHRHLALGLRQLVRHGTYPLGLAERALREYGEALTASERIAGVVRAGRRPPDEGTSLFHHLYGAADELAEEHARETVRACLEGFESSAVLDFLKGTNFDRWERILTTTDDVPSFQASADLGFSGAAGLRVYAAYDLALWAGDEFHVVDWKTGARRPRAEAAARRQLAVYGLWARSRGVLADRVRVQACWLQDDPGWSPQPLDAHETGSVVALVEEQDAFERAATRAVADGNGEVVRYEADREAFPARPHLVACRWCPYRPICPEGRAAVRPPDAEEAG